MITLFEALQKHFPGSSNNSVRLWLKQGRVLVNDQIVKNGEMLISTDVKISLSSRKHRMQANVPIIYEDNHFVVIDKPSGLLSVSTAFDKQRTAHAYLKKYYPSKKVYVVHRLDQETSGIMLFALTEDAFLKFKKMFEVHDIERAYIAVIEGTLKKNAGTWESYLYEDPNYYVHSSLRPSKGQQAITHFKVLARSTNYSKLMLHLETGRKNQIRVHCQQAGHPISGDKKYGGHTNPLGRLCLHACLLAFEHPITRKKMKFESPDPFNFSLLR